MIPWLYCALVTMFQLHLLSSDYSDIYSFLSWILAATVPFIERSFLTFMPQLKVTFKDGLHCQPKLKYIESFFTSVSLLQSYHILIFSYLFYSLFNTPPNYEINSLRAGPQLPEQQALNVCRINETKQLCWVIFKMIIYNWFMIFRFSTQT